MILYGERENAVRPVLQIAMPRSSRIYAPGGTMHVVARCNNREFYLAAPEDFEILLDHLNKRCPVPIARGTDCSTDCIGWTSFLTCRTGI